MMKILIIDDEEILREFLSDLISSLGHTAFAYGSGKEAVEEAQKQQFDLVISDIMMPEMNGIQVLEELQKLPEPPPVVLMTGFADISTAVDALKLGAYDYMFKPIEAHDLQNRLSHIEREHELRKKAEEESKKAVLMSRMAAVGQLAAGVSHEINNPTTFLRGNAQILRALLKRIEKSLQTEADKELMISVKMLCQQMPELLDGIEHGTERIRRITFGLSSFANGQIFESKTRSSVNTCIRDALILLGEPKEGMLLLEELDNAIPMTTISKRSITQAVACIVQNAFKAVEKQGGKVYIKTSHDPDGKVHIIVEDSGPGIPTELRQRIFEPFFTTREVNEGAGLGLSVAYGIVCNDHDGSLVCGDSELGGAKFEITLGSSANEHTPVEDHYNAAV